MRTSLVVCVLAWGMSGAACWGGEPLAQRFLDDPIYKRDRQGIDAAVKQVTAARSLSVTSPWDGQQELDAAIQENAGEYLAAGFCTRYFSPVESSRFRRLTYQAIESGANGLGPLDDGDVGAATLHQAGCYDSYHTEEGRKVSASLRWLMSQYAEYAALRAGWRDQPMAMDVYDAHLKVIIPRLEKSRPGEFMALPVWKDFSQQVSSHLTASSAPRFRSRCSPAFSQENLEQMTAALMREAFHGEAIGSGQSKPYRSGEQDYCPVTSALLQRYHDTLRQFLAESQLVAGLRAEHLSRKKAEDERLAREKLAQQALDEKNWEQRKSDLRAGRLPPLSMREAVIKYSAEHGAMIAMSPKASPDGRYYTLAGVVEHVSGDQAVLKFGRDHKVLIRLSRDTKSFGGEVRYNMPLNFVGKYVANTQIRTVGGWNVATPVFDVTHIASQF